MTNSMPTGVTAKRAERTLAWMGLALCLIASAAAIRLFRTSSVGPGFFYFLGLPVTFAILAVVASIGSSIGPMWALIGAMFGFVIVGAFSLGPLFIPAALVLLAAGITQLVAARSRWRTLTAPLWVMVGVFAIPFIFLMIAVVQRILGAAIVFPGETREFDGPTSIRSLAGFEIIGSWLFIGALAALVAACSARALWQRRGDYPRFATTGLLTVVMVVALIESLAIGRATAAARRGKRIVRREDHVLEPVSARESQVPRSG